MLSVNLPEEEEEEPVTTLAPAPVIQPVVSEEPLRKQLRGITFEGKLRKKGEKYNSWKSRHLFLDLVPSSKGEDLFEPYLYVLKDYDVSTKRVIPFDQTLTPAIWYSRKKPKPSSTLQGTKLYQAPKSRATMGSSLRTSQGRRILSARMIPARSRTG